MIEKYEGLSADDRPPFLGKLARGEEKMQIVWAIKTLTEDNSDAARKVLDEFADTPVATLSLTGEVTLDEALSTHRKTAWTNSIARKVMILSWMDNNRGEDEARTILSRINTAVLRDQLPYSVGLDYFQTIVGKEQWTWTTRRAAMSCIARLGRQFPAKAEAYEWVIEQVKTSRDADVRRAAAGTLSASFRLDADRLKTLEVLLQTEKDEDVSKALSADLKKAKVKK